MNAVEAGGLFRLGFLCEFGYLAHFHLGAKKRDFSPPEYTAFDCLSLFPGLLRSSNRVTK